MDWRYGLCGRACFASMKMWIQTSVSPKEIKQKKQQLPWIPSSSNQELGDKEGTFLLGTILQNQNWDNDQPEHNLTKTA
jgi:hypothetical protein